MALINNNWVFVESEDISNAAESSSHPVEKGEPITDHVQRKPIELSIVGKIVDRDGVKAKDVVKKIKELQKSGSLISYVGCISLSNMQIQSFSETYVHTNYGGADFSMTLKEVRIAKAAYVAKKTEKKATNAGTQQVEKSKQTAVYYTVKKGDCVWNLVTKQYKSLSRSGAGSSTMSHCNWVMSKNPKAFSRSGDFRTLQIGKKLLMGYRK